MRRSVLAALALLLSGCAGTSPHHDGSPGGGYFGTLLDRPYDAPDISLHSTLRSSYNFRASTTKPLTLVFFGYTHCPDVCLAVMGNLTSALTRLTDDQRADVDVLFVTTDPARDSVAELRHYLDAFDPSYVGLTGSIPDIVKAGKAFAIYVGAGQQLPSGGYDLAHSSAVVSIDAHDQTPIVWTEGTSSAQFATDITRLLEDSP